MVGLMTYLKITIIRITIEILRHIKDILHPMYEINDNALSAGVGG